MFPDRVALVVEVVGVIETSHASGLIFLRVVSIPLDADSHGFGIVLHFKKSKHHSWPIKVAAKCHKGCTISH